MPPFVYVGIGKADGRAGRDKEKTTYRGGNNMALKPCPRCQELITYGQTYCKNCKPIVEAERQAAAERKAQHRAKQYNREYNRRRDPKYARFYSSKEWRTLSRVKLQSCGYKCEAGLEGCKLIACEVHHKKPIKTQDGWAERLEWDNLVGVCIPCHNILDNKTFKKKKEADVIDLRTVR